MFLTFLALAWFSGLAVLLVGVHHAPVGYEDGNGFHEVTELTAPLAMVAAPIRVG